MTHPALPPFFLITVTRRHPLPEAVGGLRPVMSPPVQAIAEVAADDDQGVCLRVDTGVNSLTEVWFLRSSKPIKMIAAAINMKLTDGESMFITSMPAGLAWESTGLDPLTRAKIEGLLAGTLRRNSTPG